MPFTDTDMAFLKEDVGPTLAKGLAETVIAAPQDPVEYLALWLLHHLQQRELELKKRQELESAEREREEWNRVRATKQGDAAHVIQREWRHFLKMESNRKTAERALLDLIMQKERETEEVEEWKEDNITIEEYEGITDPEREKSMDRARAEVGFKKTQAVLSCVSKGAVAEVKSLRKPSHNIILVLKAYFYLLGGCTVRQVSSWQRISNLIKPLPFIEKALAYLPYGENANKKKRTQVRVRRILKCVADEKLKQESVAMFVLYQWLLACAEFRERHTELNKLKKELGREVEEEPEEEEEEEPEAETEEEKDPDEEKQRLIEEEEERLRKEEEERERRERGEEDGEAEGEE